jgi:hypothetical protein
MKSIKSWPLVTLVLVFSAWETSCAALQCPNASDKMLANILIHDQFADGSAQQAAGIYVGKDQQSAYFVTALHTLQHENDQSFALNTQVYFYQSATPYPATVLTTHFNNTYDFGIVTVDLSHLPHAMPALTVATPQLNESLIAVGHPATGNWSTWCGTVQSLSQGPILVENFVSNGALDEGFSGGGAFNQDGYFEGMHLKSPTAASGAFVKSAYILQQLQAWGVPTDNLIDPNVGPDTIKIKQIIEAIKAHDAATVQAIASSKVNLNGFAADGSTPLLQAIKSQDMTMISAVLASPTIDPNFESRSHELPLYVAASLDETDAVKIFLKRRDVFPTILLSLGNMDIVIRLESDIVLSPSFHAQDIAQWIHMFACNDVTAERQQVFGWMVNISSTAIPFPGTLSCEYNMSSEAVLRVLLNKFPYTDSAKAKVIRDVAKADDPKFDMVVRSYNGSRDVLTEAVRSTLSRQKPCALQNLRSLVNAGVNPNVQVEESDSHNGPNLLFAIQTCEDEPPQGFVTLLVDKGLDVNRSNNHHETALMVASEQGDVQIVGELLKAPGINVNKTTLLGDSYNCSALDFAERRNHVEIVRLLKNAHADRHRGKCVEH